MRVEAQVMCSRIMSCHLFGHVRLKRTALYQINPILFLQLEMVHAGNFTIETKDTILVQHVYVG